MRIQRYSTKDEGYVDPFGTIKSTIYNRDFEWYMGENNIGITPNPSIAAESFFKGILVDEDELIISPSETHTQILRKTKMPWGVIGGRDSSNPMERLMLVRLIMENEVTHLYDSSESPGGYGRILTFSPTSPSKLLYT